MIGARHQAVGAGAHGDAGRLAVAGGRHRAAVQFPAHLLVPDAGGGDAQVARLVEDGMQHQDSGDEEVHAITEKLVPYVPAGSGVGSALRRICTSTDWPAAMLGNVVSGPSYGCQMPAS